MALMRSVPLTTQWPVLSSLSPVVRLGELFPTMIAGMVLFLSVLTLIIAARHILLYMLQRIVG